ncbi:MAG: HAD family hydrolase, partial [Christensenellales bacterium]
ELGYRTDKTSLYSKLYVEHVVKKTITREQWFNLTALAFKRKGMSIETLNNVSSKIELIDGTKDFVKSLFEAGFSLHIVSGCLTQAIERVLGDLTKYFVHIESNKAIFDESGKLKKFVATPFDFAGKAEYIKILMTKTNTKASEIVFVGNGDNDEWVHFAGCKTICINADNTNSNDTTIWNEKIDNLKSLSELSDAFNIR